MAGPFFIRDGDEQLFAVHHPPTAPAESRAVLLCSPGPQEYMTTHWTLRRLASRFAARGAHVLRFDYFGTGDSSGASDEGTLERWQRDVAIAASELARRAKTERVSVVGCRLGASLAWLATHSQELRLRDLVLWDPVIVGSTYIEQAVLHEQASTARMLTYQPPARDAEELLGHPFPRSQRRAIESLDLCAIAPPKATRSQLVVGSLDREVIRLRDHLSASLKRFNFHVVSASAGGSGQAVAHTILDTIVGAISGG